VTVTYYFERKAEALEGFGIITEDERLAVA